MRISTDEALDIIGYAIGDKNKNELKRHLEIYNDWGRVKQLITKELIQRRQQAETSQKTIKSLREEIERLRQLDAFAPHK